MMKAIIIDWDDTLVDFEYWLRSRWIIANHRVERHYGIPLYDVTFWKVFNRNSIYYFHYVEDTLIELGLEPNEDFIKEITKHFLNVEVKDLVFPGVSIFLHRMKEKGFKIAMYTNGHEKSHKFRVKTSGLAKYFDVIKYGGLVSKPYYEPFVEISEQLNVPFNEIYAIGDDIRDLLSPYNLGMTPIVMDLKHQGKTMLNKPFKTFYSYEELINEIC